MRAFILSTSIVFLGLFFSYLFITFYSIRNSLYYMGSSSAIPQARILETVMLVFLLNVTLLLAGVVIGKTVGKNAWKHSLLFGLIWVIIFYLCLSFISGDIYLMNLKSPYNIFIKPTLVTLYFYCSWIIFPLIGTVGFFVKK